MTSIKERPLADDLSFGARIAGVNWETLKDEAVRERIRDIFEDRGLIVFEGMEQSGEMQLALSHIFGPLQNHAMKAVPRVDQDLMPGVVDLDYKSNIFEVDGKRLSGWLSWHFDACYAGEINRGGVLRAIELPPEGGMTGFADGIQLYNAISPELRAEFADRKIIYHPKLMFMNQRFGMPASYHVIHLNESALYVIEQAENGPRAVHPAIWKRRSGEYVLHVSPWQADGIHEQEDSNGDARLEALCRDMYAKMKPYLHKWRPTDMVAWDNWRFLHSVTGHDPQYSRRMHRTTIKGDYGLGRFEKDAAGAERLEIDV